VNVSKRKKRKFRNEDRMRKTKADSAENKNGVNVSSLVVTKSPRTSKIQGAGQILYSETPASPGPAFGVKRSHGKSVIRTTTTERKRGKRERKRNRRTTKAKPGEGARAWDKKTAQAHKGRGGGDGHLTRRVFVHSISAILQAEPGSQSSERNGNALKSKMGKFKNPCVRT